MGTGGPVRKGGISRPGRWRAPRVAELSARSPFSHFAGYDRWLAPDGEVTLHLPVGPRPVMPTGSVRQLFQRLTDRELLARRRGPRR